MLIGSTISLNTMMLGSTSFTPATLFSRGEQGVWLDPSELDTMFQDRAGTTPVTAPGQLVGLRLDKSQQLALGPELVVNGTFNVNLNGWTSTGGGTKTQEDGAAKINITSGAGAFAGSLDQTLTVVSGRTYIVSGNITKSGGVGKTRILVSGVEYPTGGLSTNGSMAVSAYVVASSTSLTISLGAYAEGGTNNIISTFDNVSVREIAGNHAVAVSDATRGIYGIEPYGGRRNLLLWTEAVDNVYWNKLLGGAAASATTFNFASTFGSGFENSAAITAPAGTTVIASFLASGSGTIQIGVVDASGAFGSTFSTVVLTATPTRYFAQRTLVDGNCLLRVRNASGVAVTGATCTQIQLEIVATPTSIANPYQRVTTQWDVTEAGVPTVHYLEYDNDAYVTPTIDPSLNPPLGPELVTNGDFSQGSTGWTLGTSWSIGSGFAACSGTNGQRLVSTTIPSGGFVAGSSYRVTGTVTGGQVGILLGQSTAVAALVSGAFSIVIVSGAGGTPDPTYFAVRDQGVAATISNVSVRELVTDEVQVFAGVRKLSDAAAGGTVAEFSESADSNNGTMFFRAPQAVAANYIWRSRGTVVANAISPSNYAAPISNVLTGLGDISADVSVLRVNGAQVASNTADQGTGSYGAYPLYIGARGGSSLFFRGRDYGIIVRFGPNLSNTMILDTEEWLGNKTGVLYVLWNGVWQDQYTWVDNLNWNDGV